MTIHDMSDKDLDIWLFNLVSEKLWRLTRAYFSRRMAVYREVAELISRRAEEIRHGETDSTANLSEPPTRTV